MAERSDRTQLVRALQSPRSRPAAIAELCRVYEESLVKPLAYRYRQNVHGCELNELEQVARLALVEACTTFEPARWTRKKDGLGRLFTQHAVWALRHALSEYVRALPNPVRLPSVLANQLPKMRRAALRLAQELGREPTVDELAAVAGPKQYQDKVATIALMQTYDDDAPLSLDARDANLAAPTPTPEDIVIAKEDWKALRRQRSVG